jgi:large repetitive protein
LNRFALTLTLAALVAGVAAMPGSAASFNDSSPCPADGPLLVCPTMQVGESVHLQLLAHDGCDVYRWEYVNGALPQGLSMSSSGLITGTPTRAETTRPWMIVHDLLASEGGPSWCGGDNHSERQFVFTVVGSSGTPTPTPTPTPAPTPQPTLAITTSSLQKATVGTPYTATLAASGASSFSWTLAAGALPAGLTLSADGVLVGTPTAAGSYTFTVRAASGGRSATKQLTLSVLDRLTVSAPAAQTWEVRRPLAIAISAHGGSPGYRWAISGTLPEDTGFIDYEGDGTTSYLKGVPADSGSFLLTVTVTDADGQSAQLTLTLTVAPKLQITTFDLGRAHRGKPYRLTLTSTGGVGPTSWALASGSLPPGLTLDAASGVISGKARVRGRFVFALVVTDALGAKRAMRYNLTVRRH